MHESFTRLLEWEGRKSANKCYISKGRCFILSFWEAFFSFSSENSFC